jgi:DNA gyrase subunit A
MPLRRLAALERKKIDLEYKEKQAQIKELETLLSSEKKLRTAIAAEITEIRGKYSDRRRTQIVQVGKSKKGRPVLTATDLAELTPVKDTWVVVTSDGLVSRTPTARLPRLAGRSSPAILVGATGRDVLYLFDARGDGAAVPVHTLPESEDPAQGSPLPGLTPFPQGTEVVAGIALPPEKVGPEAPEGYLVLCTIGGTVKKTPLIWLPGASGRRFTAAKVPQGDRLGWVRLTPGDDDLMMVSSDGQAIRFPEGEVRPMGLAAAGVAGMKLASGAQIVGMDVAAPGAELFLLSARGEAKRTPLQDFPRQGRHGKGVLAWKSGKGIEIAGACTGQVEDRAVVHLVRAAARSIRLGDAPRRARVGPGKALFEVKQNDRVMLLSPALAKPAFAEPEPKPAPAAVERGKKRKSAGAKKRRGSEKAKARKHSATRPAKKQRPQAARPKKASKVEKEKTKRRKG